MKPSLAHLLLQIFMCQAVWAAGPLPMDTCASGVASFGTFRFNGYGMEFCDGSAWQSLDAGVDTLRTCTVAGKQRFVSGAMEFCDGTNWHSMSFVTTSTPCAYPGVQLVTTNRYQIYCDGSSWHGMGPSVPANVACLEFRAQRHCIVVPACSWSGTACYDPNDCFSRGTMFQCNLNPACSWAGGVCGSVY